MEHTQKDGVSTTTRKTGSSKSKLSDALLRKVGTTKLIACIYCPSLLGNAYTSLPFSDFTKLSAHGWSQWALV